MHACRYDNVACIQSGNNLNLIIAEHAGPDRVKVNGALIDHPNLRRSARLIQSRKRNKRGGGCAACFMDLDGGRHSQADLGGGLRERDPHFVCS